MDVADHNLVFALIIRLDLPHAEGDETSFTICDELESAPFNNFSHALVELESWRWITLHLYREVANLI